MKDLAKRILRPVTGGLFGRVDSHIAASNEVLRTEIRQGLEDSNIELKGRLDAFDHHLPILLNTISSQNAAAREARRAQQRLEEAVAALREDVQALMGSNGGAGGSSPLAELSDRIARVESRTEFVRKEVMYELRYGGANRGMDLDQEAKVLNPEKLAAAGDDLKLNVGCGHIPHEEYINVDGRDLQGVDVVADVNRLPFEAGTVNVIRSAHLLEHFPEEELKRRVLPHWLAVLRPGGELRAVVPDAETMIAEYAAGRFSFEDLRTVTFGDQEYEGDFHFTMFSRQSLCELIAAVGFDRVTVVESGRRNGVCYEMEISARRPDR